MRIISGSAKGRKLQAPRGLSVRPTSDWVKEALFNILGVDIAGADFLDLYAGSGGVGLEALSRGAQVTFVEKSRAALTALRSNLEKCGFTQNYQVISADVLRFVRHWKSASKWDIIFADPPYSSEEADRLLQELPGESLVCNGLLIIEHHSARPPAADNTIWQKFREADYGQTALSFYRPTV